MQTDVNWQCVNTFRKLKLVPVYYIAYAKRSCLRNMLQLAITWQRHVPSLLNSAC